MIHAMLDLITINQKKVFKNKIAKVILQPTKKFIVSSWAKCNQKNANQVRATKNCYEIIMVWVEEKKEFLRSVSIACCSGEKR
jgi:hypothetical protein